MQGCRWNHKIDVMQTGNHLESQVACPLEIETFVDDRWIEDGRAGGVEAQAQIRVRGGAS